VGYEITPGVREREFAQWYRDLPILVGKTPITQDAFGSLFNPLLAGEPGTEDDRLTQRLMLSLSWHRQAMSHTDSLFRFLILWLAFESLTPLLTELYDVDPEGFQGLRALAEETGEGGSEFITQVLGLRRDLFHTRRVPVQGMKDRATEHMPRLQRLLVLGWLKLLGRPHTDLEMFPDEAVVPYPARLIAFARIFQEDAERLGAWTPPAFRGSQHAGSRGHRRSSRRRRYIRNESDRAKRRGNAAEATGDSRAARTQRGDLGASCFAFPHLLKSD
jgi:hypothetical protein